MVDNESEKIAKKPRKEQDASLRKLKKMVQYKKKKLMHL